MTDVDDFTAKSLATCPIVLGDAEAFVEWPGSLREHGDAQVLHYWGPWDGLVNRLSSELLPCGPGHQYVCVTTQRELLSRVGQLIEEIHQVAGKARVRAWGGRRDAHDAEEQLMAAIAASRGPNAEASLRRGTALLEQRVEVVVGDGILSVESVPANAYRRLEAEMARSTFQGALWKETTAGPLLYLRPGAGPYMAVDPGGAGMLLAEHNWNKKASGPDVLREARSSSGLERVLGTLTVSTGMIVMARAALSHHVLVPRVRDPLTAFRTLLDGGTTRELKLPKLGKVGAVAAIAPARYEVLLGATDTIRWCRLRAEQLERKP